jgi:Fe-S cluster biogenesis protein NfuA/nitrite reductase/ring-hydroxylating ferredoxin subunit
MTAADLTQRINQITEALERVPDPEARALAEDLAASILELHGEGMARLLAELDGNQRLRMADDGVVGSLLLIHGLHPVPLEERVTRALEEVRPYMKSHGGDVELVAIEDGVAQLRLKGSCNGCGASSSTLELAVERALQEAAPDLLGMDVEGAVESRITGTPLPLAPAGTNGEASLPGLDSWSVLEGMDDLAADEIRSVDVAGTRLVVARVEGSLLAYRDRCAACGASLGGAELSEGVLACPACARTFFLPRAGRSLDGERLQLEPVPLLADARAGARVALSS